MLGKTIGFIFFIVGAHMWYKKDLDLPKLLFLAGIY